MLVRVLRVRQTARHLDFDDVADPRCYSLLGTLPRHEMSHSRPAYPQRSCYVTCPVTRSHQRQRWSRTARRTASRVAGAPSGRPLSTRETVAIETPAALATSRIVEQALMPRSSSDAIVLSKHCAGFRITTGRLEHWTEGRRSGTSRDQLALFRGSRLSFARLSG